MTWRPFVACSLILGCGPASSDGNRMPVVSDSGGITIVRHRTDLSDLPRWSLDTTDVLIIGGDSGGRGTLVDLEGARRLANGSFLAIDGRPTEVRLYDSTGKFVRVVVPNGEGPGAVTCAAVFQVSPDTIAIHDECQERVVLLSSLGEVIATNPMPSGSMEPSGVTIDFSTERLLSSSELVMTAGPDKRCTVMGCRDSVAIVRFTSGRSKPDTLFFARDLETNGRGQRIVLGAGPSISLHHSGFVVGDGAKAELVVRTTTGALLRSIRWKPVASAYTKTDLATFRAHDSTNLGLSDPHEIMEWQEGFEKLVVAKRAPELTGASIADNGDIWVERDARPWSGEVPYVVFDSTGRALGRVSFPRNDWPVQFGEDYVLVWNRDVNGVRTIRRYRLARNGTG